MLGGLGLFIYGMHIMGEGLEKTAGNKLKKILEVLTTNKLMGVIVGTIITAIMQSSSATTVMVVGFVNAGLMNLYQASSVIMGANIGTTITAQIIAFNLSDIAPLILAAGAIITIFAKKKKIKDLGEIILGFGVIFVGMTIMSTSMEPLKNNPEFSKIILLLSHNPLLAVLAGTVITGIIQSSGAFIAILIALSAEGAIGFEAALPLLLGSNIGTCVTALLASIGTGKNAKKAALIHLTFNVIGTIIFMVLYPLIVHAIPMLGGSIKRQIANAHTIFNITNTIIQAPLIPLLVKFVNIIIPGKDSEQETMSLQYIDKRLLETPSVAVQQVVKETVRMGRLAIKNVEKTLECFTNFNEDIEIDIYKKEELINYLEKEITSYLVLLSNSSISEDESIIVTSLFHVVNDIERMGDHAENLLELAENKFKNSLKFSIEAQTELKFMYETVLEAANNSINALEFGDINSAQSVIQIEKKIDSIEKQLRKDHIDRLNKGICNPESGTIFLDAISNLERIGDHSHNISQIVLSQN
ncbi:Na/Pi cotransporter family protein [Caloramator sp. E03]|uniref:Na/Pi cotransporter family protein n=1 Tax=Caloramator sp. E03 TaxID=2576307 RepID=UPI00111067E8|nr:Na/Pi cotransporter family protein [Caloramator sp. E03]QCX34830.1 Na/Pi cotransporter family protein [Caloramator sp. E03]